MEEKPEHNMEQQQAPAQEQQQENSFVAPSKLEAPSNSVLSLKQRLAAMDLAYFSNGQKRCLQREASPNVDIGGRQLSTSDAAGNPAFKVHSPPEIDQRHACIENKNLTSYQDKRRAENSITSLRFQRFHKPIPPNSGSDVYKNSDLFTMTGAERDDSQEGPYKGSTRPTGKQGEAALGFVGVSPASDQELNFGATISRHNHRQNSISTQQRDGAFVSTRPSAVFTVSPRPFPPEVSRDLLTPYRHSADQRKALTQLPLASESFEEALKYSQTPPRKHLSPLQKPAVKRRRLYTPGSVNQVGPSQNFKRQASSHFAIMDHLNPAFTSADPSCELSQLQNKSLEPSDVPMTPEGHTHVPTGRRHVASHSVSQNGPLKETNSAHRKLPYTKASIVIAISGGPSSGKSTLAYLLATVFEAATIPDTGFAGAQSMYPVYNAKMDENPGRKGSIAKVVVIDQNRYLKDVAELPTVEWTEVDPYSPVSEVMKPKIGVERVLASVRGVKHFDRYWEEAYNANVGIDPEDVSLSPGSRLSEMTLPMPARMSKTSPNIDCRGSIAWKQFGEAIRDGMVGRKPEGILDTAEGRDMIEAYLAQPCPETHVSLVDSRKIEPLRERVREWIRRETSLNDRIGFRGRLVLDGSLRRICIINGQLLLLLTDPIKGAGGEKLMDACNVKLFLPTLEAEAIQRSFSQKGYMDPPGGTREPGQPWMYEGYFCEVAWKEYMSEHAWLFENGDVTNREIVTSTAAFSHGVHVRDFYSADLKEKGHKYEGRRWSDETLDWAIRMVLFQLSMEEAIGRQAFYKQKMKNTAAMENAST